MRYVANKGGAKIAPGKYAPNEILGTCDTEQEAIAAARAAPGYVFVDEESGNRDVVWERVDGVERYAPPVS